jgi:hypothetical protein
MSVEQPVSLRPRYCGGTVMVRPNSASRLWTVAGGSGIPLCDGRPSYWFSFPLWAPLKMLEKSTPLPFTCPCIKPATGTFRRTAKFPSAEGAFLSCLLRFGVIYLTPISGTSNGRMIHELERIWKEEISWEVLKKTTDNSSQDACVTRKFEPNTSWTRVLSVTATAIRSAYVLTNISTSDLF